LDEAHVEGGLAAVARSARSVSPFIYALRPSLAGAATIFGLPPVTLGRGRFSMSAVCTSATVWNMERSSGRLTNFAKRVCIR
jgi:hypothetical protein